MIFRSNVCSRPDVHVPDELLADRRAALDDLPGADVGPERTQDADVVDAAVLVEALVLDRHGRLREPRRSCGGGRPARGCGRPGSSRGASRRRRRRRCSRRCRPASGCRGCTTPRAPLRRRSRPRRRRRRAPTQDAAMSDPGATPAALPVHALPLAGEVRGPGTRSSSRLSAMPDSTRRQRGSLPREAARRPRSAGRSGPARPTVAGPTTAADRDRRLRAEVGRRRPRSSSGLERLDRGAQVGAEREAAPSPRRPAARSGSSRSGGSRRRASRSG